MSFASESFNFTEKLFLIDKHGKSFSGVILCNSRGRCLLRRESISVEKGGSAILFWQYSSRETIVNEAEKCIPQPIVEVGVLRFGLIEHKYLQRMLYNHAKQMKEKD